ncbi:hypothetical protein RvY_09007 [Ramazzottius varieornatus]|uniref:Choline transporter-like protein n=1 Tax=Ramazzottius varieornatus TaxID=947166 RepID=A0A1D1VA41_RAMVA|nr:hypothetical protein RvY_09007 [Ramazzottius varieornatus]
MDDDEYADETDAMAKGPVDESGKYGQPKEYDPDFHGPVRRRSCTDIVCLILLCAFLVGWAVVAYFAFAKGDWDRLVHPTDSIGRICGKNGNRNGAQYNLADRPYLYYMDLRHCFEGGCGVAVCVQSCPVELGVKLCVDQNLEIVGDENASPYVTCSLTVPSAPVSSRCIPSLPNSTLNSGQPFDTSKLLDFRGGVPTMDQLRQGSRGLTEFLGARATIEKVFQDFEASWWMILVGFIAAAIISLAWIVVMRWVAGPMVWLGLAAVIGLLSYATFYCFTTWNRLRSQPPTVVNPSNPFEQENNGVLTKQETWLAFGILAAVFLGLIVLMGLFLRNRIRLAIALLREASKGVGSMTMTLLWPIIPFLLQVGVFAFWGIMAVFLSSAGDSQGCVRNPHDLGASTGQICDICNPLTYAANNGSVCIFQRYVRDQKYTWFHMYNVFGLFWLGFFIMGVSDLCLAGAFATYYWTRDKSNNMPMFPVANSVGRCFRYHLGSVAFGALVIAVVRFIRWLLENLDEKLRQSHLGFARFLVKCCACCLWCLEKFLKFINKNAYIMVAIYGKNFLWSAREAFSLLMRNILRVFVLDKVTDFLLFLGKITIVTAIGIFAAHFFNGGFNSIAPAALNSPKQMNYIAVPIITVIVGSFMITSAFFGVYSMAVDTLFLCFLEDLERNDGSPMKPYYMSKNLMRILGKKNKKPKPEGK